MLDQSPKVVLSEEDYQKLSALVAACRQAPAEFLEEEISRAEVVPAARLPADRVAMHATVAVVDLDGEAESEVTLVFPHEADSSAHKVSVLAPMGAALIGLKCGDEYEWRGPSGKIKRFRVAAIIKMPES